MTPEEKFVIEAAIKFVDGYAFGGSSRALHSLDIIQAVDSLKDSRKKQIASFHTEKPMGWDW